MLRNLEWPQCGIVCVSHVSFCVDEGGEHGLAFAIDKYRWRMENPWKARPSLRHELKRASDPCKRSYDGCWELAFVLESEPRAINHGGHSLDGPWCAHVPSVWLHDSKGQALIHG